MAVDKSDGPESSPKLSTSWWDAFDDEAAVRFWSYIDKEDEITGCWEWNGALNKDRYGQFSLGGVTIGAHRVAMIDAGRFPPSPAHKIEHVCRNNRCVNPGHLLWVARSITTLHLAQRRKRHEQ
jgi:hypothetical protein